MNSDVSYFILENSNKYRNFDLIIDIYYSETV
jgi:hypothetical protein